MNRRIAIALGITLLAVGGITTHSIRRLARWHEAGMAGVAYMPVTPNVAKQPAFLGIGPGVVIMTYPRGPADEAGVRSRDVIVSVDGIPIANLKALRALDARLKAGDTITYQVRRGTTVRDVRVKLDSPLRITFIVLYLIIAWSVAAAFIGIGLFVFTRKPDDRRVTVFYALTVAGALSLIVTLALSFDASAVRGIVADPERNLLPFVAFLVALMSFSPLILHLALVFPHDRPAMRASRRVLGWVYGIPILGILWLFALALIPRLQTATKSQIKTIFEPVNVALAIVTLAGMIVAFLVARRGRVEGTLRAFWNRPVQTLFAVTALLFGIARIAEAVRVKWLMVTAFLLSGAFPLLVLMLFPVFAIVSFYRSYREAGVEERRQVKWPLWGTLIALVTKLVVGLVGQIVTFTLIASGRELSTWSDIVQIVGLIPVLVSLLIPISFAFAILKYRLMNIDVIIRKTVAYAFLTGAIIVLYLVLVGGLGTLLVSVAHVKNQTMVIASTLVVALLFVPLRNKLQTLVDRNLFRHKYEYPDALKAISNDTLTATDLAAFLSSAAEKIQQALQNRAVTVFVARHEELVAAAKVGLADSVIGTLRMARAPFVAMLDRPFDPTRHPLPDDAAAALRRIEATLVVPINTPGTPPNGFLALAPKLSNAPFDVEDIDFLRSAAEQLDVGVDRIRAQREEVDFEQARAIQQSLLPREMPRIPGVDLSGVWLSARTMAGDYYDVLQLSDTELAICIGDVAGKGMPAALLMSGLQAAVRASASNSPRDLCERVRRVVVSSLSGGRFVTFFYATIDTAAMRLRWCNAGHNAPVLARADGSVVRLSEGGPAFSRLFRDDRYAEQEIAIAAGDRIVLFTDGVSEAAGGDGEMFGEPRIEQLAAEKRHLGARELQEAIVDAATAFSGGELEDDLTLVVAAIR